MNRIRLAAMLLAAICASADAAKLLAFPTAVGFGRRACHMGQAEGCFLVAVAYHQGLGVAVSEPDADRWSEEGCRGGLAVACAPLVARGVALPLPADLEARIRGRLCADGLAAACPPR